MSPKVLQDISNIFLISGIIFFLLTIILSLKFHIFSIIKSEIGNKRKKEIVGGNDYFDYDFNKIEEISYSVNKEFEEQKNIPEKLVYQKETVEHSATVPVTQKRSAVQECNATVVVSRTPNFSAEDNDNLQIKVNIMDIHGNPDVIKI